MLVLRRYARAPVLLALVALAVTFAVLGPHGRASAHTPHPGLDFSLGVDTNADTIADCGTGVGQPTKCNVAFGAPFKALVFLNSLGTLTDYGGFDIELFYSGVASKGDPDANVWPDCVFEATNASNPGVIAWGCAIGVAPAPESTYTGLIGTTTFNCAADGQLNMLLGNPPAVFGTHVVTSSDLAFHAEAQNVYETLDVNCVGPVGGVSQDPASSSNAASRSPTSSDAGLLFELVMLALAGVLVMGAAYAVAKRRTR